MDKSIEPIAMKIIVGAMADAARLELSPESAAFGVIAHLEVSGLTITFSKSRQEAERVCRKNRVCRDGQHEIGCPVRSF